MQRDFDLRRYRVMQQHPAPFTCGVDIVDLPRFERILKVGGSRFLNSIYTEAELIYCTGRVPQLAARFAAKEAISKALGTGIHGLSWSEIEVATDQNRCPFVVLYGCALAQAEQKKLAAWSISLSHTPICAIAFVIAIRDDSVT